MTLSFIWQNITNIYSEKPHSNRNIIFEKRNKKEVKCPEMLFLELEKNVSVGFTKWWQDLSYRLIYM